MAKTIIQTIGPLYGESVNGTVFGRPNGSIYIPASNVITVNTKGYAYVKSVGTSANVLTQSSGVGQFGAEIVAQSQDIASYIMVQLSDDVDFTTYGSRTYPAGNFNVGPAYMINTNVLEIVAETTYYLRAVLYSSNGEPVAVSDVIELTGVA